MTSPQSILSDIGERMERDVMAAPVRSIPAHIEAQRAEFRRRWLEAASIEADRRRGQRDTEFTINDFV